MKWNCSRRGYFFTLQIKDGSKLTPIILELCSVLRNWVRNKTETVVVNQMECEIRISHFCGNEVRSLQLEVEVKVELELELKLEVVLEVEAELEVKLKLKLEQEVEMEVELVVKL
jgi:hypothetical protein